MNEIVQQFVNKSNRVRFNISKKSFFMPNMVFVDATCYFNYLAECFHVKIDYFGFWRLFQRRDRIYWQKGVAYPFTNWTSKLAKWKTIDLFLIVVVIIAWFLLQPILLQARQMWIMFTSCNYPTTTIKRIHESRLVFTVIANFHHQLKPRTFNWVT
jgi:hypothetical protein